MMNEQHLCTWSFAVLRLRDDNSLDDIYAVHDCLDAPDWIPGGSTRRYDTTLADSGPHRDWLT